MDYAPNYPALYGYVNKSLMNSLIANRYIRDNAEAVGAVMDETFNAVAKRPCFGTSQSYLRMLSPSSTPRPTRPRRVRCCRRCCCITSRRSRALVGTYSCSTRRRATICAASCSDRISSGDSGREVSVRHGSSLDRRRFPAQHDSASTRRVSRRFRTGPVVLWRQPLSCTRPVRRFGTEPVYRRHGHDGGDGVPIIRPRVVKAGATGTGGAMACGSSLYNVSFVTARLIATRCASVRPVSAIVFG